MATFPRPRTEADIPADLTPDDRRSAILDMVRLGGFAATPALARWAGTDEAVPVLRRYLLLRTRPAAGDLFSIDLDLCEREDAGDRALAREIEARFG